MKLQSSSASSSPSTTTLQKAFEEAVLCFIFGPPKQEEKALKKVKEISDFVLKYRLLEESEFMMYVKPVWS